MNTAYLAVTLAVAAIVAFSAVGKLRHDPHIVRVINEIVGVPMKYFPVLAACEFSGAFGLVLGIWLPHLGVAAGIGLVLYFVAAIVSHLRVGDLKGIGPAFFMLIACSAALAVQVLILRPAIVHS